MNSDSFSPDVASGSYDQTVRIWNAKTGNTIGESLQGHTYDVTHVSPVTISPDEPSSVSGSMIEWLTSGI